MDFRDLEKEALQLPAEERLRLAQTLNASVENTELPQVTIDSDEMFARLSRISFNSSLPSPDEPLQS